LIPEAGRRGMDWLIPLHMGDDKFVALVGQDMNCVGDSVDSLVTLGTPATSWKLNPTYFLSEEEQGTFTNVGLGHLLKADWPAILFAVGVDDVAAGVAELIRGKTLSGTNVICSKFPCIVLSGLDYGFVSPDAEEAWKSLRTLGLTLEDRKEKDIPITYGW